TQHVWIFGKRNISTLCQTPTRSSSGTRERDCVHFWRRCRRISEKHSHGSIYAASAMPIDLSPTVGCCFLSSGCSSSRISRPAEHPSLTMRRFDLLQTRNHCRLRHDGRTLQNCRQLADRLAKFHGIL